MDFELRLNEGVLHTLGGAGGAGGGGDTTIGGIQIPKIDLRFCGRSERDVSQK